LDTELRNEAAARLERMPDARDDFLGLFHPVNGSIAEDCIDFLIWISS
jgi:hypothetical protein